MSKAKTTVKTKKAAGVTVFLVVRDAFDAHDYDGIYLDRPTNEEGRRVSVVPVRAFATKAAAAAFAKQCDEDIRRTFPPPLFAGIDDDKPFTAVLAALLKKLGLPAVKFGKEPFNHGREFRQWWAENAKNMSAEQKAALWEPFAGMTFHRVKQVELEG
jgi:hypothetical protein